MPRVVVALSLLVGSSAVFVPGAFDAFSLSKLTIAAAGVGVAATCSPSGRLPRTVVGLFVVGLALVALLALVGGTPIASLTGRFPRYEGLPVLALYVGCAWAGARLLGPSRPGRHDRFVDVVAVVSVGLAITATLDGLGLPVTPDTAATRSGSVAGNATDLAVLGVLSLAVLLAPAVTRRRPLTVAGAAAALVTVAAAGSRAAVAAAVLVVVVHALRLRGPARAPIGAAAAALVVLVLVVPATRDRLLAGATVTGREVLWADSWRLARDHLALGVGPSRYVDAIGAAHGDRWVELVGPDAPPDSPHLWPLQALLVGGVPLLVLAAVFTILVALAARRRLRLDDTLGLGLVAAAAAYGLVMLTHFPTPATAPFALVLVGALLAEAPAATWRWTPRVALAGAVAACLLGAAAVVSDVRLRDGVEAASDGRLDDADSAFTAAYRWRLGDGDVAMIAAQSLAADASNDVPGAASATERWADRSLSRTPDTYQSGLARAVALLALDRLDEAESELDDLVSLYPAEPQARLQRALARYGRGDAEGALVDLTEAGRLDPDDPTPVRIADAIDSATS